MSKTCTIATRELASFFYSPIAYVVMSVFMLLAGLLFMLMVFRPGEPAQLRWLFFWLVWVLVAVAPGISMRLIAEDLRSGTIETLMTSPVSDAQVVIGKWLGGVLFFVVLLCPTLVFVILLAVFATPDYGPIISGYLGMLLVGALYIAIGTCTSVMSKNQIIAFLLTVFIILLLTVVTYFLPRILPVEWGAAVLYLNVNEQYDDFAKGLIDLSNFVYFISGTVLFLVVAVKLLESRKWR